MSPFPICYCTRTEYGDYPHVHVMNFADDPNPDSYRAELRRLRRYERAVVRYVNDNRWEGGPAALRRLAAASLKRSKKVRRG